MSEIIIHVTANLWINVLNPNSKKPQFLWTIKSDEPRILIGETVLFRQVDTNLNENGEYSYETTNRIVGGGIIKDKHFGKYSNLTVADLHKMQGINPVCPSGYNSNQFAKYIDIATGNSGTLNANSPIYGFTLDNVHLFDRDEVDIMSINIHKLVKKWGRAFRYIDRGKLDYSDPQVLDILAILGKYKL